MKYQKILRMKSTDLRHSIRKRRKELGLSAQSVADQAKTTQSNVLNFENGKANITIATLERICEVLGLDIVLVANTENKG